jgi:hypothetical protein
VRLPALHQLQLRRPFLGPMLRNIFKIFRQKMAVYYLKFFCDKIIITLV